MAENINYRELLDIILHILYRLKFEHKKKSYHSLSDIINGLDYPLDITDIYEVGKYLEAQGFIKAEFEFGDVFAEITSSGMIYVEEELQFDGKLKNETKADRLSKIIDSVSQYDEDYILEFRKPLINEINEMKNILKKRRQGSSDIGKDIDILKIEMEKNNPEMDILEIKLNNIERERILKKYVHKIRDILFI
ncbi:MAG: hypothetical protein GY795_48375 [Desulfobacterales bacterium]|nr:hypothetical protein [Desulfobacterales bacterium]